MSDALGEAFQALVSDFFNDCGSFTICLAELSAKDDAGGFRELCHEIKGAAGLLGFSALSKCAANWEEHSRNGEVPGSAEVGEVFTRLVTETRTLVDSNVLT